MLYRWAGFLEPLKNRLRIRGAFQVVCQKINSTNASRSHSQARHHGHDVIRFLFFDPAND